MNKTPPKLRQIVAMVVFALSSFAALLFLWVSFGGPVPLKSKGYQFHVLVPEAAQLTSTADVRISGVDVGKVVQLRPAAGDRTDATIQLDPRYAPIPRRTKAILRFKTLLGETFVELAPNREAGGGALPEGGTLPRSAVTPTVELDEVLRALDPTTRRRLQILTDAGARGLRGRAVDLSMALADLPGTVDELGSLAATLDEQQTAVRRTVSGTARVAEAVTARDGDLRGLVASSQRTFAALAARDRDLAETVRRLPRFGRELTDTLPPLTALARHATPTVERLLPAADALTPTLEAFRALSPDLRVLMDRLRPVTTASRLGLPALSRVLVDLPPVLDDVQPLLRTVDPIFRYLGTSRREVAAFLANLTAASQYRVKGVERGGGTVNMLRIMQTLTPEGLAFPRRPAGQNRSNAYMRPGGMDQLAAGLESLSTAGCANGDPAPPTVTDPPGLGPLLEPYVFRTAGRDAARPACRQQAPANAAGTAFTPLTADPPLEAAPPRRTR